jgi:glutaredoxin
MFEVVALEGCPYSQRAVDILTKLKHTKVIWVNHETKHNYKTAERNTFPQISYTHKTKQGDVKKVFIGGMNELEKLIEMKNKQE